MAFQKPDPHPVALQIEWRTGYPAEQIPKDLRHEEVTSERSVDGKTTVACRIYRWPIIIACWNNLSKEWEVRTATAFSHRRVDNGGEIYSGVSGSWNQSLDRRLWKRWGPFSWCMLAMPEKPASASERKAGVASTETNG